MPTKIQERNKTSITRAFLASLSVVASATVISASLLTQQDAASALNVTLAPTNFTVITGLGGTANFGDALNTTATPNGFGNYFNFNTAGYSPNFLAVGATTTAAIDSSTRTNSTARATFSISLGDIKPSASGGDLFATFNYAYLGNTAGNATKNQLILSIIEPIGNDNLGVFAANGQTGYSNGTSLSSFNFNGSGDFLTQYGPGTYTLEVAVNETGFGAANTAAGFGNIAISSTPVPFDFDPSVGIAILGAGYGLNKLRKKFKAKKDIDV